MSHITNLLPEHGLAIHHIATLLTQSFTGGWSHYPTALATVRDSLSPDHISRIATDTHGTILGWLDGFSAYDGHVWELHALVVDPYHRHQGIGRALVTDFETLARARHALTITLGTDDEDARTSLANRNLFPNILEHATHITNLNRHPYEFYQKLGYIITGIIPDANGLGKPDILMAKSLVRPSTTIQGL